MVRAFANLTGLGKVLVSIGALIGACLILLYAIVTLSSSSMTVRGAGVITSAEDRSYRWEGGILVLALKQGDRPVSCTARPDSGEQRKIPARVVNGSTEAEDVLIEPWFTGPATVTCAGSYNSRSRIDVYPGTMAELKLFSESGRSRLLAFALVAVPVGLGFFLGRRRATPSGSPQA